MPEVTFQQSSVELALLVGLGSNSCAVLHVLSVLDRLSEELRLSIALVVQEALVISSSSGGHPVESGSRRVKARAAA